MIHTIFFLLLVLIIVQRLTELVLAKRNTERLFSRGGVEFGAEHYPAIVALHTGFFISVVVEYWLTQPDTLWSVFLVLLVLSQVGRVWIVGRMRERWTTRVIVIPGEKLIDDGPFRFLRHPNYIIVGIELFTLPMIFGLTATAIIFTVLNALILIYVRIPVEEAALEWSQKRSLKPGKV